MVLQIVAVRDRAIGAFGQPNFVVSVGGATRSFSDEVNRADPQNAINRHADDFEFYHLGSYDDQHATFDLFEKPRMIAVAKDLLK